VNFSGVNRKSLALSIILFSGSLAYAVSIYGPAHPQPALLSAADPFVVGSRVTVDSSGTRVRSGPSRSSSIIGTQNPGSEGTITQPCQSDGGTKVFCDVDFDIDPDGWVARRNLVLISSPSPTPTPTPTVTPSPTPSPSPTPTASPTPTPTPAAGDYYVSPFGSDSNPGTRALPFKTIQKAADVVNPGQTVIVQDGIYADPDGDGVIVNLSRGGTSSAKILFKSENRWGAKLDGRGNSSDTGFRFQSAANYIRLEGFEVFGVGNGGSGGAAAFEIYNGGHDSEIVSNNIHDIGRMCTDTTNGEVGVFVQQPNVLIEGNLIHDIGRFAPGEQGCQPAQPYYKNHDHGIYIDKANDVTIQNNVFHDCKRGWAIQVYPGPSSRIRIYNNTFAFENPYNPGHIIMAASGSYNEIKNNVFYDPLTAAIYFYSGTQSQTVVAQNLIYGGTISTGNASGVTFTGNINDLLGLLFLDVGHLDFHLSSSSPARNVGLNIPSVQHDFDGVVRPQGPAYDLGAYESAY